MADFTARIENLSGLDLGETQISLKDSDDPCVFCGTRWGDHVSRVSGVSDTGLYIQVICPGPAVYQDAVGLSIYSKGDHNA